MHKVIFNKVKLVFRKNRNNHNINSLTIAFSFKTQTYWFILREEFGLSVTNLIYIHIGKGNVIIVSVLNTTVCFRMVTSIFVSKPRKRMYCYNLFICYIREVQDRYKYSFTVRNRMLKFVILFVLLVVLSCSCLSFCSLFFGLRTLTRFSWAAPFILTVEGLLVHVNKIVICCYSDQSTLR